jgi:hypothetical protein
MHLIVFHDCVGKIKIPVFEEILPLTFEQNALYQDVRLVEIKRWERRIRSFDAVNTVPYLALGSIPAEINVGRLRIGHSQQVGVEHTLDQDPFLLRLSRNKIADEHLALYAVRGLRNIARYLLKY